MNSEIFKKYGKDPLQLCKDWLDEAEKTEPNDPEAVCLATCDAAGTPSNRMVLVKDISENGFKFHTNEDSRKGRDMTENPKAAMCFYWKSIRKQIRVSGTIKETSAEEADQYFTTRPIERQIGAWASQQSKPFEKWDEMEAAVKKYEEQFAGKDTIPRPPYWKGYRLAPTSIEFWVAHKDRLHTRFVYTKTSGDPENQEWTATWLCP